MENEVTIKLPAREVKRLIALLRWMEQNSATQLKLAAALQLTERPDEK